MADAKAVLAMAYLEQLHRPGYHDVDHDPGAGTIR